MEKDIWHNCLNCKSDCCEHKIAFPLYLTPEEKKQFPKLANQLRSKNCPFLNNKKLCGIHTNRPLDCRLFPFDVYKINGKFFWMVWKIDCAISKQENFEPYLQNLESNVIPKMKKYLHEYDMFRWDEMRKNWSYKILREINLTY